MGVDCSIKNRLSPKPIDTTVENNIDDNHTNVNTVFIVPVY